MPNMGEPTSPPPQGPPPGWRPPWPPQPPQHLNAPAMPPQPYQPTWGPPSAKSKTPPLVVAGAVIAGILAVILFAVFSHDGSSSGGTSSDVQLITPINPDCATSATLCKSDAELIRNACNGGTTGIGLLLNSASDATTKALYESELSALCPEKQVH
jgi:hypothetical protein